MSTQILEKKFSENFLIFQVFLLEKIFKKFFSDTKFFVVCIF